MRKPWWKTSNRRKKKDDAPKELTPELKGQYFLTVEDHPTTSQDHWCATLEVIGRHVHSKGDNDQDLTEFFDHGRLPLFSITEEPLKNATRVEEAL